jgi:excisionase family DNA binding protein
MSNSETQDLLTVSESAHLLRLRPSTIRAWILRRRIPYLKLGGCVCLRRVDLEAFLERSLVPALSNQQDGFKSAETPRPGPALNPTNRRLGGVR